MGKHDGIQQFHVATAEEQDEVLEWLEKAWSDREFPYSEANGRMVIDYAMGLIRRDELHNLEKHLMNYVDLTTVYIIRAILEHGQERVTVAELSARP